MTNLSPAHAASQALKDRVTRKALDDAADEIQRLRKELGQALDDLDIVRHHNRWSDSVKAELRKVTR